MKVNHQNTFFYKVLDQLEHDYKELDYYYASISHLENQSEYIDSQLSENTYYRQILMISFFSNKADERILGLNNCITFLLSELKPKVTENEFLKYIYIFIDLENFDVDNCKKTYTLFLEIFNYLPFVFNLNYTEFYDLYKLVLYFVHFPEMKNHPISSIKVFDDRNIYSFYPNEVYHHFIIEDINPVIITDYFFKLSTEEDYLIHNELIKSSKYEDLKILKDLISEKEFEILQSENHPVLDFNYRNFSSLRVVHFIKLLANVNLPNEMIYRIFFNKGYYSKAYTEIERINQFITYSIDKGDKITYPLIEKFLAFITKCTKDPILTENKVNYLYTKGMSILFKDELEVFRDECFECRAKTDLIYCEWEDPLKNPKHQTICQQCLDTKTREYDLKYNMPF
jgi:hypothetical protein